MDASEERRKRLCMPSLFSARSVMCVYAPEPATSSEDCVLVPHLMRDLSPRAVPGVTYASVPMMGLMPAAVAFCQNSYAPNMLPWSVTAIAGMPDLAAASPRG